MYAMAARIRAQFSPSRWVLFDSFYGSEDFVAKLKAKSWSLAVVVLNGFAKLPPSGCQKANVQVRPNSTKTS